MKIVIIAGGKGTRIASVRGDIPKAMIPVEGMPILERQVLMAKQQGFCDFLFIIGHLGEQIQQYFGDGSQWGVHIDYYRESVPLGTAGALALVQEQLTEDFFVFYADTIMDIDLQSMLQFHHKHQADATLLVHPNDHPYDSDLVDADGTGRVKGFFLKPHPANLVAHNQVNASLFIFSPKVLTEIEPEKKQHIEKDVLPRCIASGMRVFAYRSAEYIKDMGTPDRYEAVQADVRSGRVERMNHRNPRRAVFLDRDGTISEEVNLLHSPQQLRLIDGAAEAIRLINQRGWLAIVVTNQPVIARNLCSLEELDHIHAKLETLLGNEGAYLNAIYFCPHHPDSGFPEERKEYKIDCNCRKPKPGMLLQAAQDWNIDLSASVMIGDTERDVLAGQNAGVSQSINIQTNQPGALLQAVQAILN